jgi:hypothetical protein
MADALEPPWSVHESYIAGFKGLGWA